MIKAGQGKIFYGYVVTLAGSIIWLVGWGSSGAFGVFFKPILDEFKVTRAAIAGAYAFFSVVKDTLSIVTGWLTDKVGPRIVVPLFGSFLGIGYLMMSQINAIWQFDVLYGLAIGVGLSVVNIPVMTTISRWFIKRRGLMLGLAQAGVGLGGIIFPPLTAWLILNYSWRFAFIIFGPIVLVSFILCGLLLRRDPAEMGLSPYGAEVSLPAQSQVPESRSAAVSVQQAVRTRTFWMMAGLFLCFGLTRCFVMVHIVPHITDLGFSLSSASTVLAVTSIASIFGRVGMGRLADLIGSWQTFIISYAATALVLLWAIVAVDLWALYLFAIVFGFGWGAQAVLRYQVTSEKFGGRWLGSVMAVIALGETVGSIIGSVIGGYIFDVAGNYQPAFVMGAGASILGIILTWLLR